MARDLLDLFPWIELAQRKKGLREGADNATLRAFLASDGKILGDPATRPRCGDFVETCIAVTLPSAVLPANPYKARNWLKFGRTVDPCFGAILVFWRGSRNGEEGDVGFYYAEDDSDFHVLGSNQSDSVSVARIDKSRLLVARLPLVGGPYSRRAIRSQEDWARSVDEA